MYERLRHFYRYLMIPALLLAGCGSGATFPLPVVEDGSSLSSGSLVDGLTVLADDDAETPVPCIGSDRPSTLEQQTMFDALNLYRVQNGLAPLQYSRVLESTIEQHCIDLFDRDYFDHVNPEGLRPSDRAMDNGFCHRFVGENLAAGQSDVLRVMTAWEESPSHNANMLEPEYVYVGMAKYTAPSGRIFWGQLFAYHVE